MSLFQILIANKATVVSAVVIAVFLNGAYKFIRNQYGESKRRKLSFRIQGLRDAVVALESGLPAAGESAPTRESMNRESIEAEIAQLSGELAPVSRRVEERQFEVGNLGFFQRLFLLYPPVGVRAWIAHFLCWFSFFALIFYAVGMSYPEGGDWSLTTLIENWKDPEQLFGGIFWLGSFVLTRTWGLYERKRILRRRGAAVVPRKGFERASVAAWLYWMTGIVFVAGGIAVGFDDLAAGLKLGTLGLVTGGSGLTLYAYGRLRDPGCHMTTMKALGFLFPAVVMTSAVLFEAQKMILKAFRQDPQGFWRAWTQQPMIPILFLPVAALPLYAGLRCLQHARRQDQDPELARAA